jgi:hypothetical protein
VRSEAGNTPLKVIALGPGDGNLEVRFVQASPRRLDQPDIELVLFDISQPLLNTAYQHALGHVRRAVPCSHADDAGELSRPRQLPPGELCPGQEAVAVESTRCWGNTLANLDNELRFFQHCMSHCEPGDLLIVDVRRRQAPLDASIESIRRSDPILRSPFPKGIRRVSEHSAPYALSRSH